MPSHIHLLCKAPEEEILANTMRDFKRFTSKKIIEVIKEYPESRRAWLLPYFKNTCAHLKRNQQYKFWQDGYHAEQVYSNAFIKQKLNDIHNNPVKAGFVDAPCDWLYGSEIDYEEEIKGVPDLTFLY